MLFAKYERNGGKDIRHTVRYRDITKVTTIEMDETKLTPSQFKRAVLFKALADYIFPILTKWKDPQGGDGADAFQVQMAHYRQKYAEEFQRHAFVMGLNTMKITTVQLLLMKKNLSTNYAWLDDQDC
jgi:hypothetical protein